MLHAILFRLRALRQRRRVAREMDDEFQFHLAMEIDKHVGQGQSRPEAERAARIAFGGFEQTKEAVRDIRTFWPDRIRVDVVHAWRSVRARPGVSVAILLVLAAGIGLVTAMFSLADPFVLRPLPYVKPHELVVISAARRSGSGPQWWFGAAPESPLPTVSDWRARTDLFTRVAAYGPHAPLRLRVPGGAASLETAEITDRFLDVLGIPMSPDALQEPADGPALSVVLTAPAFARVFGAREEVIGQTLRRQDGGAVRIVGVLPQSFLFPSDRVIARPEALVLAHATGALESYERSADGTATMVRSLTVIARLRAGVPVEGIPDALAAASADPKRVEIEARPLSSYMTQSARPVALGALAAGLLILFVCTGNVANLVLVRGAYRRREFATRESLGASRGDLARLVLIELGFVVTGAVAGGLLLARAALAAAGHLMPLEYLTLGQPSLTGRSIVFACVTGAFVMLAEIVPAAVACRAAPSWLAGKAIGSDARSFRVLRFTMAASQSALAIILVVGAALLAHSYVNLTWQDTGFSGAALVATMSYPDDDDGVNLQHDIDLTLGQLRRIPGVQSVGATTGPMVNRMLLLGGLVVHGQAVRVMSKPVTPGYFAAVGSTFTAGRAFGPGEKGAVVVNETLAKRCWPNGPAVGEVVGRQSISHVVGVVRDAFDFALDRPSQPTVYSLLENPSGCLGNCNNVSYIVRAGESSSELGMAVRRAVSGVNRDSVVIEMNRLDERLAGSIKNRSFALLVLGLFAAAGITVCSAGLAGIVAFLVRRRTRDIAICMALGARPRHVLRLVLTEALTATTAGMAVGLVVGRWASKTLEHLLYRVHAGDWPTVALAVVVMLAITLLAAMVPAARALRLSPTDALRVE